MDHVPVLVAEHLDLDVARIDDELLDEDAVVAKGGGGFRARPGKALDHLVGLIGDAHAFAAAAGRRLQHDGIADLIGDLDRLLAVFDDAEMARNHTDFGFGGEFFQLDLVAHRLDRARIGSDEDDALVRERLGEGGALGEETVARMNRLGARLLAGRDNLVDQQIRLPRRRRPEMNLLVRHLDMQRVLIGVRIDRDGGDAHLAGGLNDAASDLATIGDQNFTKHARSTLRPWIPLPRRTASPAHGRRSRTPWPLPQT